jgi:hypothetical protein
MATKEIQFVDGRPSEYTKYTVMPFSSWRALESFAKYIKKTQCLSLNSLLAVFIKYYVI